MVGSKNGVGTTKAESVNLSSVACSKFNATKANSVDNELCGISEFLSDFEFTFCSNPFQSELKLDLSIIRQSEQRPPEKKWRKKDKCFFLALRREIFKSAFSASIFIESTVGVTLTHSSPFKYSAWLG